jgi:predicted aspartyl protease
VTHGSLDCPDAPGDCRVGAAAGRRLTAISTLRFRVAAASIALIFLGCRSPVAIAAGQAVRDLLTWSLLALVLVAGYSYREDLLTFGNRVAVELLPGTPLRGESQIAGERSVRSGAGRRAFRRQGGPTA